MIGQNTPCTGTLRALIAALLWCASGAAGPATEEDPPASFLVELVDGSSVLGAAAFTLTLETPYGPLKIPAAAIRTMTADPEHGLVTLEAPDLQVRAKCRLPDIRLQTIVGTVVIKPDQVRTLRRAVRPALAGQGWIPLLAGDALANWRRGLPLGEDGVLRMTTPVNTWGAAYKGKLPERFELRLEVKFAKGARTDIHVMEAGESRFVRVSEAAGAKAGEWLTVRLVRDGKLRGFVEGREVELGEWRDPQAADMIALSSDFAESQFRNIMLRALK